QTLGRCALDNLSNDIDQRGISIVLMPPRRTNLPARHVSGVPPVQLCHVAVDQRVPHLLRCAVDVRYVNEFRLIHCCPLRAPSSGHSVPEADVVHTFRSSGRKFRKSEPGSNNAASRGHATRSRPGWLLPAAPDALSQPVGSYPGSCKAPSEFARWP